MNSLGLLLFIFLLVSFSFVSSRRDQITVLSAQLPPDQFNALQDFYVSLNGDPGQTPQSDGILLNQTPILALVGMVLHALVLLIAP
jgi:hypothetical protein